MIFLKGLRREVQVNDIYKCPTTDECEHLVQKLERYFSTIPFSMTNNCLEGTGMLNC